MNNQKKTVYRKKNSTIKTFGGSPSLIVIIRKKKENKNFRFSFIFTPQFLIYCRTLYTIWKSLIPNPKPDA